MKNLGFRLLVLWIIACITDVLPAQTVFQPFRSSRFERFVSSEYFDVYYKDGNEAMATRVAKYAEMARSELGFLYDYKPSSRYVLRLLNHPYELTYTNALYQPNEGYYPYGIIPLPKLDAAIIVPDDPSTLYYAIKRSVSEVILKEFGYGQDLPNVIQNELLSVKPPWFYEGLSAFVADGWTYRDELLLQSTPKLNPIDLALNEKTEAAEVLRKSIWFFIAQEYGPQKFAELIYLAKITHSVETAIIAVLGIPLNTFTQRWKAFLIAHIEALNEQRVALISVPDVEKITLPDGYKSLCFAGGEDKMLIYGYKNGKILVWVYEKPSRTFRETGIAFGYKNKVSANLKYQFPAAWFPDENKFLYTLYHLGKWEVWEYDMVKEENMLVYADSSIQRILHLSISHDGSKVAFSAIQEGKTDIWIGYKDFSGLRKITHDVFDDLNPEWSYDDNVLYFSSNRETNRVSERKQPEWDYFKKQHDIFAFSLHSMQDTLTYITQTPEIQERMPYNPNSYEVFYLSDNTGMWDLYKCNLFTKETEMLTKMEAGIETWQTTSGQDVYFSVYENGKPEIYTLNRPETGGSPPPLTPFRKEYLALLNQKKAILLTKEEPIPEAPEKKETAEITPLRYYIFDDNVSDNHSVEPGEEKKEEVAQRLKKHLPEWKNINITSGQSFKNQWRAEYLQMSLVYHALPRSGVMMGVGYHDLLHHHRIEASVTPYFSMLPFIQFGNADARVNYVFQALRPDFHIETGGAIRVYQQEALSPALLDSLAYRFTNIYGKATVTYPFSTRFRAGISQAFHRIQKQDLRLVYAQTLNDDKRGVSRSNLFVDFTSLIFKEESPVKGTLIHGEANFYRHLTGEARPFSIVKFSAKHYQPVWKNMILATNFQSGFGFGESSPTFYLGGIDNWFLGILRRNRPGSPAYTGKINLDVTDFSFQEFAMPVRGFWFNSRNGNKYLVANWDLRIPFSNFRPAMLNAKPILGWELIPFFDVGTVWKTGNPFSQKSPTDVQVIYGNPVTVQLQTLKSPFVWGFGAGIKSQFLNYIMRMDLAWGIDDNTLQKPVLTLAMGRAF